MFRKRWQVWLVAIAVLSLGSVSLPVHAQPANPEVILATTTSTQDSGLLDTLVPLFEQQSGYRVKTISVGTGQALALGERGEADVVLVHAPPAEKTWMAAGHGIERQVVMYNDFVVLGAPNDPAGVASATSGVEAMQKIAANAAPFVSRGDNSGTNQFELQIWKSAGVDPKGQPWYLETGQGMGQTLTISSQKQAYTISDRGTFLAQQGNLDLAIQAQGYKNFLNVYHVMVVNPEKGPTINVDGARAFAGFLVAPETQAVVSEFGVSRFGQPLFFPAATMTDEELGV